MLNKQDWLLNLRRVSEISTLDKIIERKENSLSSKELVVFYSASDHRYAEIKTGRLYDKIPPHVWKLV
ncbi:Hha/YmoA family nucleoid-associated regulatory protein [Citrobacter portucalensis]|uniref:Hha/YmoA family nucleoid-associated regulatory protein n=1 Tax=Citrobacter sp. A316 TaxID=1639132 RepID=UPI0025B74DAB|nr:MULTISPECIES: Hha/YmoA family nucleoid-associated regulatory protein [Citrobacter freundii complex]MDN4196372.1 Hha/YmoA family nucleoid-associated regulatory protein [Citrobacter freundii]MDN4226854.1 Hha/YmoA family nucleoid-associated regulatory protein [Citrobacter freundii]MDN4360715.1 Hha/YmoA family nucleoid-associated regulatory protein [Citrobacter portucalensis]MDN4365245.1 Hha/YmoA family nucleoid-associated regulatory protein [Citrobacter portucalensis]MDN4380870.1 Hha/YmoA fami